MTNAMRDKSLPYSNMSNVLEPLSPLETVTECLAESFRDVSLETADKAHKAMLCDISCFASVGTSSNAEENRACSAVIDLHCSAARDMNAEILLSEGIPETTTFGIVPYDASSSLSDLVMATTGVMIN